MKKFLVLSLALFLSVMVTAQEKISEGIITSEHTMSSDNEQMNAQLKSIGDTKSTSYFKGDKSRNETSTPMTGDMTIIIDGTKKQMLMLMNQPGLGKKYGLQSIEPSEKDLASVIVKEGDETKTILGYKCQQYIVTMKQNGQDVEMEMFTTKEISAISQNTTAMGDKVKGFPLYFIMKTSQMGSTIEVSSEVVKIEEVAVSDDKFSLTPPDGFTKLGGM